MKAVILFFPMTILLFFSASMQAFSAASPLLPQSVPQTLAELQALSASPEVASGKQIGSLRQQAQHAAAMQLGIQSGLAARLRSIAVSLEKLRPQLDSIYNFSRLLLEGNILPPVIIGGSEVVIQDSDRRARHTRRVYHLVQPARMVSASPLWSDYLLPAIPAVQPPDNHLLPSGAQEQQQWRLTLAEAWQIGGIQAETNFRHHLARLQRDYQGMLEYHRLSQHGMIDAPVLTRSPQQILVAEDSLRIDDQVLQISEDAAFVSPSHWQPAIIPGDRR